MNIAEVIKKLQEFPMDAEVVVLDDANTHSVDEIGFDGDEPPKVLIW